MNQPSPQASGATTDAPGFVHSRLMQIDHDDGGSGASGDEVETRVFVVEDEAVVAMDLSRRLKDLGYQVCGSAGSGETAATRIQALDPDVVLMDINLGGGMSGLDVARRIQASCKASVVFLTAYSGADIVAEAVAAGAYGFLVKPFNERELYAALRVAVARGHFDEKLRALNASLDDRVRERTAELAQALQGLQEANRTKHEFLLNMNHEMRTPLNHITGLSEILKFHEPIADVPLAVGWVDQIQTAAWQLVRMVESLFDLKDIAQAPARLELKPVDPQLPINEALQLVVAVAAAADVRIEQDVFAPANLRVKADHDRLRQVLINLLLNAVKYNRQGGSVALTLRADTASVTITVSDTGDGMCEETQARAMAPFARFVPHGKVIGGIGIGLTVANHIVETMGGRLSIQSRPSAGTVVTVTLQRAAA